MDIGYACINMQLSYPQKWGGKERGVEPITTNRSMIKRTFESKGTDYASEITLKNVRDLEKIVSWNILNGYKFFRITSNLAPWKSEYEWDDLKDIEQIRIHLRSAGIMAKTHGIRLTSHPGPFNVLTSPHEHVVENCIKDLSDHADVFDMLGQSRTPYNKINIHIGGAYGDKPKSMERFCKNFERLPDKVKSRLTLEMMTKNQCIQLRSYIMEYTAIYACPSCLTIITTSSVMVGLVNKRLWSWLYQLGQRVLNQLSTTLRVGVLNKKMTR